MCDLPLRPLSPEEIARLYETDMRAQFLHGSLRPLSSILALTELGLYSCFALFAEGIPVCYAAFAGRQGEGALLLDYLATIDGWKNKGLGSELIKRIRSEFCKTDRILIESEEPNALSGAEAAMAARRLGFYARNGFAETGLALLLFGTRYRVLCDGSLENGAYETLSSIYRSTIPPEIYAANVRFWRVDGQTGQENRRLSRSL